MGQDFRSLQNKLPFCVFSTLLYFQPEDGKILDQKEANIPRIIGEASCLFCPINPEPTKTTESNEVSRCHEVRPNFDLPRCKRK